MFSAQPRAALYTASISNVEILDGITALPKGRRRAAFAAAAEAMFADDFEDRVLFSDAAAAVHYAEIVAAAVVKAARSRPSTPKSPQWRASPAWELPPATPETSRAAASPW